MLILYFTFYFYFLFLLLLWSICPKVIACSEKETIFFFFFLALLHSGEDYTTRVSEKEIFQTESLLNLNSPGKNAPSRKSCLNKPGFQGWLL